MKLNAQPPKQTLNKAFLKQPVNRDDITLFKTNLQTLLGKINDKESEEHHKNFIRDFLKDTLLQIGLRNKHQRQTGFSYSRRQRRAGKSRRDFGSEETDE